MNNIRLTRFVGASLFGISLTVLAGCGGSGSTPVATANNFAGTYTGDFLSTANPSVVAPVNFTIDSSGKLQGVGGNLGATAAISGNVTNSGTGTISVAGTAGTWTGTFANNQSVFYVTFVDATTSTSSFMTLVKNPLSLTTGANPFTGPYAGTDDNTTDNITGPVAFTIDGSGNVVGVALNNHVAPISYTFLSGNISGSGASSGTFNVNASIGGTSVGSGTGKLSLANAILSGTFVVTNGVKTTNASVNMKYLGVTG